MLNKKFISLKNGQGIVESVFAIGILALVLGGAVILVILGASNRRNSFDRRKATELATLVSEELVVKSQSDPVNFWKLNDALNQTQPNFPGYNYSVDFTNKTGDAAYPNCGIGKTDCAEVVIHVGWSGKEIQTLDFNRFFYRK